MNPDHVAIVIAVLGSGGFFSLVTFLLQRKVANRKTNAEADKTSAEAWALLVKAQSEDIVGLRSRIEKLESESAAKDKLINEQQDQITCLEAENGILKRQVEELEAKVKVLEQKRGSARG